MTELPTGAPSPIGVETLDGTRQAAMRWLDARCDRFVPADGELGTNPKALLELLLLLGFLVRRGTGDLVGASGLLSRVTDLGTRSDIRDAAIIHPTDVILRAALCAVLAPAGRTDPHLRDRVQRSVDDGVLDHGERLTYQSMEELTFLDWAGIEHELPSARDLMSRTMLTRPVRSAYLGESGAYALTHLVMFGTAMGGRSAAELGIIVDEHLMQVVVDLLVRFQRIGHWDLVGELLLCWDLLNLPDRPHHTDAWRRLLARQDPDGSVLGIVVPDVVGPQPDPCGGRAFAERYHTTLVLTLAATVRADRESGRRPPPSVSQATSSAARPRPQAARRHAEWLVQSVARAEGDRTGVVTAGALVGMRLLAVLEPSVQPYLDAVVDTAAGTLTDPAVTRGVPVSLRLLACGVLRSAGVVVVDNGPDENPGFAERILRARSVGAQVSPLPLALLVDGLDVAIAHPSRVDLAHLAALAAACATYGTADIAGLTAREAAAVDAVEALGAEALRRSDVRAGAALLRAAHTLRPLPLARRRLLVSVAAVQATATGGYASREETLLRDVGRATTDPVRLDLDLDVRLPVALSVWWALAETATSFRLYRDVVQTAVAAGV